MCHEGKGAFALMSAGFVLEWDGSRAKVPSPEPSSDFEEDAGDFLEVSEERIVRTLVPIAAQLESEIRIESIPDESPHKNILVSRVADRDDLGQEFSVFRVVSQTETASEIVDVGHAVKTNLNRIEERGKRRIVRRTEVGIQSIPRVDRLYVQTKIRAQRPLNARDGFHAPIKYGRVVGVVEAFLKAASTRKTHEPVDADASNPTPQILR